LLNINKKRTSVENIIESFTLDEIFKSNPKVIINFYASWCKRCMKLKPHYEEFASKYKALTVTAFLILSYSIITNY
jgi:thiol-disulfide isomerase/thioredoxin